MRNCRTKPGIRPLLLAAALTCASVAANAHAQTTETQPPNSSAYLTDQRDTVLRNATYLCWHTGSWTPAAAIAECDPDLVSKPVTPQSGAATKPAAPTQGKSQKQPVAGNRTPEGRR